MRIYYSSFRRSVSTISYAQFPCKLQSETKTIPIILLKISWYDNSCQEVITMLQGLSVPFACVGSGDPVRVLRLYTTSTLDIF